MGISYNGIAKSAFEQYPNVNVVYISEDGNLFLNEVDAKHYSISNSWRYKAYTRETEKTVKTVKDVDIKL